jgi:hypothetical protein
VVSLLRLGRVGPSQVVRVGSIAVCLLELELTDAELPDEEDSSRRRPSGTPARLRGMCRAETGTIAFGLRAASRATIPLATSESRRPPGPRDSFATMSFASHPPPVAIATAIERWRGRRVRIVGSSRPRLPGPRAHPRGNDRPEPAIRLAALRVPDQYHVTIVKAAVGRAVCGTARDQSAARTENRVRTAAFYREA